MPKQTQYVWAFHATPKKRERIRVHVTAPTQQAAVKKYIEDWPHDWRLYTVEIPARPIRVVTSDRRDENTPYTELELPPDDLTQFCISVVTDHALRSVLKSLRPALLARGEQILLTDKRGV